MRRELAVVGDEALHRRLHHRVPAVAQQQARFATKTRGCPVQGLGALGQRGGGIDPSQSGGQTLKRRQVRLQGVEQRLVELPLAHQRAFAGGEGAVLECLQFGRDVALGILERLPAAVLGRKVVRVCAPDLDVEAVDAVVLHFQARYAGALAFAGLQCQQEVAAAAVQRAQLIEFGIGARGDHAAVLEARRRLWR